MSGECSRESGHIVGTDCDGHHVLILDETYEGEEVDVETVNGNRITLKLRRRSL